MRSVSWRRFGSKLSRKSCPGLGIPFVTEPCVNLQFTAPSGSTDFHSFHRPPKKEKRSKKERNGYYYYRSNFPLTPTGEYYKGILSLAPFLDELLHILRSKPQQLAELHCLKPWLFPGSVISHPAWGNGKPLGNLCGCEERAVARRMVLLGRSVQTGFSFLHGWIMAVIPNSIGSGFPSPLAPAAFSTPRTRAYT
jgi:hypothetical protein